MFRIDPEFKKLIPPLSHDEYMQLEENINTDGCREPLTVWQEEELLLDGHNRFEICKRYGLSYELFFVSLPDRQSAVNWIIDNQLGRRNLNPTQATDLRGRRYNGEKAEHGGDRKSNGKNYHLIDEPTTAKKLAAEYGVSEKTIRNDGKFADAVDVLDSNLGEDAFQLARSGKLNKQDVVDAAQWYRSNPGKRPTLEEEAEELTGEAEAFDWTDGTASDDEDDEPEPEPAILVARTEQEILKAAKQIRTQRAETKKQEKEAKKQEILAKYDEVESWNGSLKTNTISVANIHDLQLPCESIDMVFTDPPYHDEYIGLYEQLARVAEVALKPGGYLMTYAGKMFIPEIISHLSSRLEYVSIYAVFQPFSQARIVKHNVFENWRPILVFRKPGKTETKEWAQDVVRGTRDKSHHEWQQDSEAPLQYIAAYTKPGDIVLDPFVGGGTTPWSCKQLGRYYVCFDANEDAVKLSTERVTNG